jgi:hypothetical protein
MDEVEYSIDEDFPVCSTRKTKSLYLYRQEGSVISTVARFTTPLQAERFAKEWGYPLWGNVKAVIANYKKEKGIPDTGKGGEDE